MLVLAVGVGTEGGSLIPDPDPNRPGEWLRDSGGNVVKTALKADVLQQLARETRGHYLRLDGRSIDAGLVNQVMAALDRQENEGQPTSKPIERFHWPLSLALLLLLIAWTIRPAAARLPATSRGLAGTAPAALIAIGWFTAAAPVSANWLGLLGGSNDEARRAAAALEAGDPESAAGLYSELLDQEPPAVQEPALQIGLASASYALGKYDEAAAAFSAALARQEPSTQKHSHQGLAHTLYDQGDRTLAKQPQFTLKAWRDAVRHFNAALAIAPEDAAVQENRDFVQKRLDELQQQMEQQKQQQKQKGDKGDKGEKGEKGRMSKCHLHLTSHAPVRRI